MFPNFTGTSRRPRNVNLSGQRNTNPWATPTWSPASSGASKTVAHAQAEREKRQRDREVAAATRRIQRVWRGHKTRQSIKARQRQEFDTLYRAPAADALTDRLIRALPLLLALFDPAQQADQDRLDRFVADIHTFGLEVSTDSQLISTVCWDRLAQLLVGALEKRHSTTLLDLLVGIVKRRPSSITPVLRPYYKLLTLFSEELENSLPGDRQELLLEATAAPLGADSGRVSNGSAYDAFAFSFLTSRRLPSLQSQPKRIASFVDLSALSQSVVDAFSNQTVLNEVSKDDLLYLLAHFIALNRASRTSQSGKYLEALYLQLSFLATEIRSRLNPSEESKRHEDDSTSEDDDVEISESAPLSGFAVEQLDYLVNETGVSQLLSRFTSTVSSSLGLTEDASLLAGYTLVLLRCFPSHGDDIKMRLFQSDISITKGDTCTPIPSVKYFARAAFATSVFRNIAETKAQEHPSAVISLLRQDQVRDLEWRTVLLFLELYNFLMRVTDDGDFLPSEAQFQGSQSAATTRIRSSGLSLDELKRLVSFLKHLSFPLYYNIAEILPPPRRPARLPALMGVSSTTAEPPVETKALPSSFAGIIGMDVMSLRATATTTMRSLYERDSRRPFLPQDFWLMTKRFDMEGFISAVLAEEQRKYELAEEDDSDSDEEGASSRDLFHTSTGQRLSRAAQIEKQRQLRKHQREQLLARAGPKLEILRNMPFAIPFHTRVQIFRQFVFIDKTKRRMGHVDPDRWRLAILTDSDGGIFNGPSARGRDILGRHTARVKRGDVFEDALDQFYPLGEGLKEPIQITFVDQFDNAEAGIDGGGVTKEFLTTVTSEAFAPGPDGQNLFVANSQNLLSPNPSAFDDRIALMRSFEFPEGSSDWKDGLVDLAKRYEFLGRLVGKCMYEGILIDIAFAGFFLLKWSSVGQSAGADYRANLNDLRDLDPELYQGLINLKNYPGDVADLALDFTITDQYTDADGQVRTITRPLRKDGENIPVTNKDRPLYISYVAHHRLVAQPYRQTKAFLRGLGCIINPSWLSMFNQSELQRLVGGDSSEIDVDDLRNHTQYSGLYEIGDDGEEHQTIKIFWQVMRGFADAERRDVLKYVTSTPRAPLLGFSQLSPPFSIRDAGTDETRLPSTSTCVNLLKLPRYTNAQTLKEKLLYAVQSGAGFDLS